MGKKETACYEGVPVGLLATMYDYLKNRNGVLGSTYMDGFGDGVRYAVDRLRKQEIKTTEGLTWMK